MTLPVSGAISFNNINVELGVSGTTQASLGQASYRTLAGVASGAISMSNFYGKSNAFNFTVSANVADLNIRTAAVAAGWDQSSKVVCTINSGVYVYASTTGVYACTVNGSFPNGVQIINNGVIQGKGGNGGSGGAAAAGGTGGAAGPALNAAVAVSITNNGAVNGGGGGGGGGGGSSGPLTVGGSGGGGIANGAGGVTSGSPTGGAATLNTVGAGGNPQLAPYGGKGGNGGAVGSVGSTGLRGTAGTTYAGGSGGAAGACTSGNVNITWLVTGTRNGALN